MITGTDRAPMTLAPAEPDASMAMFRKIEPEWLLLFHLAVMPSVNLVNLDVCGADGCMILFSARFASSAFRTIKSHFLHVSRQTQIVQLHSIICLPRAPALKCYRSLIWSHLGVTIMRPPDGHLNEAILDPDLCFVLAS